MDDSRRSGRPDPGVHLVRSAERVEEIDALAATMGGGGGGRVGVDGVLGDLNREARAARVPASAARWGFRWDNQDSRTARWWPQGVTTSGDRGEGEGYDGRRVVCTSWYSKTVDGLHKGSRVTFVDVTDPERLRYRHVLLVDAFLRDDGAVDGGAVDVRPVRVHAGGIVWHGDHLHVAGTSRGISTFHLDDLIRVADPGDRSTLGVGAGWFGYRYVLPVRFTYDGFAADGTEKLRYSFLSLDRGHGRGGEEPRLVAGEYARAGAGGSTRLVDFAIDPGTSLLRTSEEGHVRPLSLASDGVEAMQGAVVVDGTWFVASSAGRFCRGSLHVGRPGAFRRRRWVLPVGVEDLAYWPGRDELWSLSEYPGRRYVFAMDRASLL